MQTQDQKEHRSYDAEICEITPDGHTDHKA